MNKHAQEIYDYILKLNKVIEGLPDDCVAMYYGVKGFGFELQKQVIGFEYRWGVSWYVFLNAADSENIEILKHIKSNFKIYKQLDLDELLKEVDDEK